MKDNEFKVLAVSGDTHLGGEDFDNTVLAHCIEEFKNDCDVDVSKNPRAMRRLRQVVEKGKCTLSSANEVELEADALADGEDFSYTLTRAKFESLCKKEFDKCIPCLE